MMLHVHQYVHIEHLRHYVSYDSEKCKQGRDVSQ